MDLRYTRHQVARGSRPDATVGSTAYIVKKVTRMRLTYQIRLLTFLAEEQRGRLVVRVPRGCALSPDLRTFVKRHASVLRIEKAD
jgi:hypothetical protein